ncbi:MAG: Electron transfer flavoprotein subunit beta [Thermoproteota archaeon]|nr:Electron transfer flavoprotein subunit beta [Thermoproteota archaeon]
MEIIVCIKQVPAITEVRIDPETNTLVREGVEAAINPFDMYALEEGIRLRERYGGWTTVMSMGPSQAESALREALALGVDHAILLSDKAFAGADTLATAYTLACGIRKIGVYDIVICGLKTTDGDTGQVGPGLAEELGMPHVSYVRRIIDITGKTLLVERSLEDYYEEIEAPLPSLITVTKEINEPRLPSFKGKMAARKAPIEVWNSNDLGGVLDRFGIRGSPTQVMKVFNPQPRLKGELLQGNPKSQADQLVKRLVEKRLA